MFKRVHFSALFIFSLFIGLLFPAWSHAETTLVSPDQVHLTDLTFNHKEGVSDTFPLVLAQSETKKSSSSKKSASRRSSSSPEGFGLSSFSAKLGLETGPSGGWGSGYGLGIGADFFHLQDNLYLRADLDYKTWSQSAFGASLKYSRMPISVSGRIYIPVDERMRLYAQGGLGLSFDSEDAAFCFLGTCATASASQTNIDLIGGAGIQAQISPGMYIGGEANLHIVQNSYFDLLATLSFDIDRR